MAKAQSTTKVALSGGAVKWDFSLYQLPSGVWGATVYGVKRTVYPPGGATLNIRIDWYTVRDAQNKGEARRRAKQAIVAAQRLTTEGKIVRWDRADAPPSKTPAELRQQLIDKGLITPAHNQKNGVR